MEKFEQEKLLEVEGLQNLSKLFLGFSDILAEFLEEYQEVLDPNLVVCLECVQYDVTLTLDGEVKFEDVTVPGINKQLSDVMDEVQTLDCGGKTKDGIPDED